MKKLVSLFIAFILLVSMVAVSAVAFADDDTASEEPAREVSFQSDKFAEYVAKDIPLIAQFNTDFSLNCEWALDAAKVAEIFPHIKYILKPAEEPTEGEGEGEDETPASRAVSNTDKYAVTAESDKIFWEYCTPSKDYKEKWTGVSLGNTISVASTGWYAFRYVVKESGSNASTEKYLARSQSFSIYFSDERSPILDSLSSDMKEIRDKGVQVGKTYSIKTNLTTSGGDTSTTVSYVVYKKVNGSWTTEPIYDSETQTLAEGYEGIKNGVITFMESDVLPNNEPIYKIVYTFTNAYGYSTVSNQLTSLEIFATAEPKEKMSATQIWQIVLYVVAGLSAVGIVVVLCIKPKQSVATETYKKSDSDSKE